MAHRTPFTVMAKPIGPRCNIDCTYCYYLEKARFFPAEKSFRMLPQVLERFIREQIEASVAAGLPEVAFSWQGGEPTMLGVPYFREILALQTKYQPTGIRISNALQTNGMLLNDDWGRFLADNAFLVGISIDGPKDIHNRYRRDRAGRPSFDAVMRGLDVLQRHDVAHNALTVVHRQNGGKGKAIYRFLKGLGIEYMQFIPVVERATKDGRLGKAPQVDMDPDLTVTRWSVGATVYGKFLCDVFDAWFRHDIGNIFVQFFDTQLGLWLGRGSALCVFAETCGAGLALEHNGDLYACDHYVYPGYRLGNITGAPLQEMAWSDRQQAFGRDKSETLTGQCRACRYRFACNGGCPKHRFARSKDGEAGQNYFCGSYKAFFRHAGPRLQDLAQVVSMGRPAADVHNVK